MIMISLKVRQDGEKINLNNILKLLFFYNEVTRNEIFKTIRTLLVNIFRLHRNYDHAYLSSSFCPFAKISISDRLARFQQDHLLGLVVTISITKEVALRITGRRRYDPWRMGLRGYT